MPLWLRLLTWISGAVLGLAVVELVFPLVGWIRNGSYRSPPFILAAIIVFVAWLAIRRYSRSPSLRSVAASAAWVAIPLLGYCALGAGYIDTRTAYYRTAMKSDLRNLVDLQEDIRQSSGSYTAAPPYRPSAGVSVPRVVLTPDGWTGEVTHAGLARSCVIFMGSTPIAPAVESNTPTCPREPIDWSDYLLGLTMLAIGAAIAGVAFAMERRAGKARTS
jgi:hypothetical protein